MHDDLPHRRGGIGKVLQRGHSPLRQAPVWRARGARQAFLSKALRGVEVRALDDKLGREAGALLAKTGGRDVMDAAVVLLCEDGDAIVTSDVKDLRLLAETAGGDLELLKA